MSVSRCSFVKTLFGVVGFFVLLFSLLISVEARDYHIRASDGEVYTIALGEEPGVNNFSFRDADGEILRGVTEAERAIATELYFAAKFFWSALPWYRPENDFEDWEASVKVIAEDALDKLGQRQIATMVAQHSVTMLLIIAQPNLFVPGAADVISNINGAIAGELERAVLLNASFLAQTAGKGAVKHEGILRGLWSSYETRSVVIPIDEINDAWESHYKAGLYIALASKLVSQYLQVPNFEERISTFLRSIAPFANKVETLASITYSNEHLQDLHALRENSVAGIHREAKFQIYLSKRKSRAELEQAGFFQPIVDTPLEDIRISINDDPQRLDVRDYFSPKSDNLLYVPQADDESVAVARTEAIGSSIIIITPQNIGRTSVEVTVVGPRDLSVTDSFMVSVVQDTQHVQRPEPYETIDHQLLLIDGSARTLDVAPYFSWNNPLDYEVSASPPGVIAASVSGSRVTLTPRQLGNASVVVRAYDRNDRNLYATQAIPVLVYTNRATIVRPATPATFTPPATANPAVEGLRKGVSVITQLDPGFTLSIRTEPRRNSDLVDRLGSGVTGTIIDGPRKNGGFTWWKIRWDASRLEGWSVEADRGQILFRRPPDLEIRDLDVSDDEVKLGESFTLEAEVHNDGPGESAVTEIYFYYSQNRHSSLETLNRDGNLRIAGRGTVEVSALGEDMSRKISVTVEAPADPDTYYYGAVLRSNILETDYTEDLDADFLRNNLAREVDVKVRSAPDLIVESISTNRSILDPGERFTLETTIRNQGIGTPERSARLRYYRSSNADISTRDTEVGSNSVSSSHLGTNGIGEESIRLMAPSQPGIYYYGACVELRDEEDTDNNCSGAVSITVRETGVSDLVVSLPTLSHRAIGPGESFMLEATVRNQGDGTASSTTFRGYQSDNTSISSNDTEIGSVQVSSLAAGATEIQQFSLTAPLAVGTYYYGVAVDSVEYESNTANNRSASVALNVENRAPVVLKTLPPQALVVGNASVVDVAAYFSDPNEDILTYYVFSDAASVVVAEFSELSNSELTLTPLAVGTATITIEVGDGEFTATQTIDVSVTSSGVSEETWMPDANLRAAVRNALGLAPGDVLTQEAIQGLIFLEASAPLEAPPALKINDLTGLEHAMQLAVLSLRHNEVVDVSVVSGLTQLILLDIRGNEVVDVSPLSDLTQLTELSLDGNPISDLAPLRRLKAENPDVIIDIDINAETPLVSEETWMPDANLRAAVREALGLAPGDVLTQEAMQRLTRLDASMLSNAPVSEKIIDLTGLEHATQLTELRLWENEISDISPLSDLTQLTWLSLGSNGVVDVSPLSGLTQLTGLDLNSNGIVDISPLSGLTQLTSLSLGFNNIVDISPLLGLTQLTALFLNNNDIVDVRPLSGLSQLTKLYLNHNDIINIRPLSGLTQLTGLGLSSNKIVDMSVLSGLTRLTLLSLGSNQIIDVSALESLVNLNFLYLKENPIADLAPLRRLKAKNPDVDIDIDISVVVATVPEETWMPDANLRAAVREALGLAPTDVLTQQALQDLTELDALGLTPGDILAQPLKDFTELVTSVLSWETSKISDLTGLEHATRLMTLNLGRHEVKDLSPLSGLMQLKELFLIGNKIKDLSPLSGLTQLRELYLGDVEALDMNPLSLSGFSEFDVYQEDSSVDLSPLSGLTQLRELYLGYQGLSDINALSGLTQLRELYLVKGVYFGENKINDVRALSGMTQLRVLYLRDLDVVDVSPLSGMTQLTWLHLGANGVVDVSPLSGLTQLRELDLRKNAISDISSLSGMTQLRELDLAYNDIVDVSALSGLRQLRELDLSLNDIVDVRPLSGLTQLRELDLQNNEVINLSPLSGLTQLRELSLSFNDIMDVRPLSGLTQLRELSLGVNNIVDVRPLSGLRQLTRLGLAFNGIVDVSALPGLRQLMMLNLRGNDIVDVRSLSALTQLTGLDLQKNQISDVSALEGLVNLDFLYLGENPIADFAPLRRLKAKNPNVRMDININANAPAAPAAPTLSVETALLSNYPNPFNPETWIPYQLSKPTDVTVSIYSVDGRLVRTLALGHQSAGVYQNKSRAAYWDGRNDVGERVASGVYFYTFTAGSFTAIRKMLIRK